MSGSEIRQILIDKFWRGHEPFAEPTETIGQPDMQGWNSNHPFLAEEISRLKPAVIVEVGVWKGGSSIHMARTLKEQNLPGVLISIDTWLGSWDHWEADQWFPHLNIRNGYPSIFQTFAANVRTSGVVGQIVPLPIDSINASHVIKSFGISPQLIHIDGGHDYRAVTADLETWWPILAPGGTLIGDDYHDDGVWPEVKAAFDDFVRRTPHVGFEFYAHKCRLKKPN